MPTSPTQSESRFFPSSERCPYPECWHSTEEESTELEVTELIAGLVRGLQPRLVIETGSGYGQTTMAIAEALDRNGHGMLITYEHDPGRRASLPKHSRVKVEGASLEADLVGVVIDFAFFDSFPEFRVDEFRLFRQWMRPGTIVAFHDTAPEASDGAGLALRMEIAELDLALIDLPIPRGLTLGEVR